MATIKDVARLAGVGVGTASRVISGKGPFSQDAARKVEAAAQQLGFRPSAIARALSSRSTGTIGVFVPDFKGPFYGPLLHAIDTELRSHDRHMVCANGCGHEDARQQALDGAGFLIDRECDGIVVFANALRDADYLTLRERMPRIAVVNRDVRSMKAQCFTVDHRAAGRLAADALLAHGHRRIAVISGPRTPSDNRQRLQGFFERLAADGIGTDSIALERGDFCAASGWACRERCSRARRASARCSAPTTRWRWAR
jgi:LacI family transcriptional regulator